MSRVVDAYARNYFLGLGDREERRLADEHFWAWEAVRDHVENDTDPLPLLDALVHHADGDQRFRSYVAA